MTRTYTLKKRAEQQAETRRRIVEAAVDLHSSVGPALTTLSQVAERAGVQRHTLYAHFPDERTLFMARGCPWKVIPCLTLLPGSASRNRTSASGSALMRFTAGTNATRTWPHACCAMPNTIR